MDGKSFDVLEDKISKLKEIIPSLEFEIGNILNSDKNVAKELFRTERSKFNNIIYLNSYTYLKNEFFATLTFQLLTTDFKIIDFR
jgi:hypothetical protein